MIELIIFAFIGFVCYQIVHSKKHIKNDDNVLPNPVKVLIEKHSDCYYAFTLEDKFLLQDQSLYELISKIMKDDPAIIIATNDNDVIIELKKIFSSEQLHHIDLLSNPKP